MNKLSIELLNIGDRLVTKKLGVIKHHALYVGYWKGEHLIAENQREEEAEKGGVRLTTLRQFLTDNNLERIEYNNYDRNKQNKIIHDVNRRIGKEYRYLMYNCEHFVNEILTGKVESKQVKNGIIALILVLLIILLSLNQISRKK